MPGRGKKFPPAWMPLGLRAEFAAHPLLAASSPEILRRKHLKHSVRTIRPFAMLMHCKCVIYYNDVFLPAEQVLHREWVRRSLHFVSSTRCILRFLSTWNHFSFSAEFLILWQFYNLLFKIFASFWETLYYDSLSFEFSSLLNLVPKIKQHT